MSDVHAVERNGPATDVAPVEDWAEYGRCLLPELAAFGWSARREKPPGAGGAASASALQICYFRHGRFSRWIEGTRHECGPGDLLVIRPGERHGIAEQSIGRCEQFWLRIVVPGELPAHAEAPRALAHRIVHEPAASGIRKISVTDHLGSLFELLLRAHGAPRGESIPYARALLESLLHAILQSRARPAPGPEVNTGVPASAWVQRLAELAELHRDEPEGALAQLAREAGLNEAQLGARFQAETGCTPSQYVKTLRLREAQRLLLATDRRVTQIAFDLGFSSSQYFATSFRRHLGMSPVEFRWSRQVHRPAGRTRPEDDGVPAVSLSAS